MAGDTKKTVLLVGATGGLGSQIANALLNKPGVALRCLVRPDSRKKLADLEAKGAELVEGDLSAGSEADLARACAGVFSVVSAVQGGPDVIIDGQLRLLRAALSAGARRFIPSDYSYDLFKLDEGININSDWRRQFGKTAAQEASTRLEVVHVLMGCFTDRRVLGFLGLFDGEKGVMRYWGDGNVPLEFTTYEDTARYTAEAATDPNPLPAYFYVAGDSLTIHELARIWQETTGRKVTVERLGSLEDLKNETARRLKAEPQNMYGWLPLMYAQAFFSGQPKLGALLNSRYPHIRPATVRDSIRQGLL
jgi:nucleoside-diphosphate-sugar epimerase